MGLGAVFGGAGFVVFIIIAIVIGVLKKASAARAAPPPAYEPPPGQTYEPPETSEKAEPPEISGLSSIEALKGKDPNFSERVFLDKAQTIFFELQKAWMARDLKPIRPYVSDGVFNRWQVFIDQYKRDKQINVVKDPVINNARVVRVQQESDIDSITVRMDCSMADAMVSESNPNQVISGSLTDHKPFTEYWTFIRKASSQTKADATAKIDKCPNCGAPLKVSAAGNCEYCDTLVHSPEYDWILNQITQAEEWA
jgi:predicted lipid-binding transport protein (Tim44 family)